MINRAIYCLLLISMVFSIENLGAQVDLGNTCMTVEYNQHLQNQYPNERNSTQDFENWIAKEIANIDRSTQRATIWTIPIVFHVFHDGLAAGTGANLSAADIQSQITQINIDFANMSGSTDPLAADSQIQFCAATIDPNGDCMAEPGIDRVDNTIEGFTSLPHAFNYIENTLKAATYWSPADYINVWITHIAPAGGGQTWGYAQFPNNSGLGGLPGNSGGISTDGVVVDYRTVGSMSNPSPFAGSAGARIRGRTLSHELGHYFGLRHIWGDAACGSDDFCNDTPESDAANTGCPVTHTSCGTIDMVRNFMDYTNDACMRLFTADQADRMFAVMGGNGTGTGATRRETLNNSTKCSACSTCGNMVALAGNQPGIFDQESGDWIISTQAIQAGASVDYDGTTYVQLDPNFCVPANADFNAFIDGCNSGAGGINLTGGRSSNNLTDEGSNVIGSKVNTAKGMAESLIERVKEILFK